MTRSLLLLSTALLLCAPSASAQTLVSGATARCCQSDKGPEPVAYSGRWLDGMYTRDKCVSVKYGFWDGDDPNEAKKVCAIRDTRVPEDPVPPPTEETHK
jgi:hypothetical protein